MAVIGLLLLPMCIGLYRQFDLHPEKVLYGRTGTSGLGFFFWTQSFGRITGSNVWNNNAPFYFLMLNMLWAFLPWTLFFFGGFFISLKNFFKSLQNNDNQEFITLGGFVLGYLSMGLSKYQLPHYLFVCYPFAAIMTAHFLQEILGENKRPPLSIFMQTGQWLILSLLWSTPFLIMHFVFPSYDVLFVSMMISMITCGVIFIINAIQQKNIIHSSIYTVLTINAFLTIFFYPKLLNYQLGSEVGRIINYKKVPQNSFFTYKLLPTSSLHFYTKRVVKLKDLEQIAVGDWIITNEEGLAELQTKFNNLQFIQTGNTFHVTLLNFQFLNKETRENVVGQYFLVRILEDLPNEPEQDIEQDIEQEIEQEPEKTTEENETN
ncbi:MAG: hypothetical protein HC817_01885 [Saprospiraceae bacterium]|nr:hypothetical protein [Saprospiraceae bacterium]